MVMRHLQSNVHRGRLSSQINNGARSFSSREEIVEGVWIFHRHGDRTPGRPLVADSYIEEEAAFWRTKIPPLDRTHYEMLREKFSAIIHENHNGQFLDADGAGKEPYGFLTWKGMEQMYDTGNLISQSYHIQSKGNGSFTDYWDITAFSTNYLRTVKSCQCFLDGLLSTPKSVATDAKHINMTHYENVNPEDYLKSSSNPDIAINVRDIKHETLNAFNTSPELMKRLVEDIIDTPEFIDKDSKAASLAARLSNFIPGLVNFTSYGGPSGINWIHASDHFICRSSHDVTFTKFSHLEHDNEAEQTLRAMSYSTLSHLALRFRSWYQNPTLLAAMGGPPLKEVNEQMDRIINAGAGDSYRKPFTVFSCHDVTILALLYGIGADFLACSKDLQAIGMDANNDTFRLRYWPHYASTLTIELVRVKTKGEEEEFLVKTLLNGKPVRTMAALRKNKESMNASDFNELMDRMSVVLHQY